MMIKKMLVIGAICVSLVSGLNSAEAYSAKNGEYFWETTAVRCSIETDTLISLKIPAYYKGVEENIMYFTWGKTTDTVICQVDRTEPMHLSLSKDNGPDQFLVDMFKIAYEEYHLHKGEY